MKRIELDTSISVLSTKPSVGFRSLQLPDSKILLPPQASGNISSSIETLSLPSTGV